MFILGGLVSVAFGMVLFARPDIGALTLALLFGLFPSSTACLRSRRAFNCATPGGPCTR
jgi:uncharacterized membrane protein HdeD (DUF308 family)